MQRKEQTAFRVRLQIIERGCRQLAGDSNLSLGLCVDTRSLGIVTLGNCISLCLLSDDALGDCFGLGLLGSNSL
jgi:hypothetical protein